MKRTRSVTPSNRGRKMTRTKNAVEILDRITGQDPELRAMIEEHELDLDISQKVYDARTRAGLTQTQLARRIGTTQSVVSRLEDAEYRGHSVQILRRIARALNLRLEIRFDPSKSRRPA